MQKSPLPRSNLVLRGPLHQWGIVNNNKCNKMYSIKCNCYRWGRSEQLSLIKWRFAQTVIYLNGVILCTECSEQISLIHQIHHINGVGGSGKRWMGIVEILHINLKIV